MKAFLLVLTLLCISKLKAEKYYFSNSLGDDTRSASEAQNINTPWKSLSKLSTISNYFGPGDSVLLKRGDTFRESVSISSSGDSNAPIVFSAYGIGASPIVTVKSSLQGWKSPGSWTSDRANIWHININFTSVQGRNYPHRIWISGVEGAKAKSLTALNDTTNWFYDPSAHLLYIYAPSNPSLAFSNIEYPGGVNSNNSSCFWINGGSYIKLKNLDIRGGLDATVILSGAEGITIEDCNIGTDAGFNGISGFNMNNVVISGSSFDTGDQIIDKWYSIDKGLEDGISLSGSCNYWKVYSNTFKDWGHACIYLFNLQSGAMSSNNKFYSNYFTAADVDYCRAFAADVLEGNTGSVGNEFYYNYIENMTAAIQINCPDLKFHHNIINNVRNANHGGIAGDSATGYGIVIQGYGSTAPHNMSIYNNVISNTDEPGFYYTRNPGDNQAHDNSVINNIFYNCGSNSTRLSARSGYAVYVGNAVPLGNLIFKNNLLYNPKTTRLINNGHFKNNVYSKTNDRTVDQYDSDNGLLGDVISGNINGDPLFTNANNGDFTLQAKSPALGRGIIIDKSSNNGLSIISDWPFAIKETTYSATWDIGAFVSLNASTLPLNFLDIKASTTKDGVQINWTVSNEVELGTYEIQKSINKFDFITVATVEANGTSTSSSTSYKWLDTATFTSSDYFYRIKIRDEHQQDKFSNIVNVHFINQILKVIVFPNPITSSVIKIKINAIKAGKYQIKILNFSGQTIYNKLVTLSSQDINNPIDINVNLSQGLYQLQISQDNTSFASVNIRKI